MPPVYITNRTLFLSPRTLSNGASKLDRHTVHGISIGSFFSGIGGIVLVLSESC